MVDFALLPSLWHELPPHFYSQPPLQPLSEPRLTVVNPSLAAELGLPQGWQNDANAAAWLAGSLPNPSQKPLATVYSGHQFGVWAGQLGDGRAMLMGDVVDVHGVRQEIQLKGAGQTPYSRGADGRAVLRSSIREYACSEYLHALGIPTTRALALAVSPDAVYREQAETAAVVTRVAPSFLRFGHFEHYYHRGKMDDMQRLADFALHHYFAEHLTAEQPYLAMFADISRRSAELVAAWQSVGFCHGVLNTDNMSLLGLTLDYGPFGFMDGFDFNHICNHSDSHGRYAYAAQPPIVQWNLSCLASCFVPFVAEDALIAVLNDFADDYRRAYGRRMRAKLGLQQTEDGDDELILNFLRALAAQNVDFTLAFRELAQVRRNDEAIPTALAVLWQDIAPLADWLSAYRARLQREAVGDEERAANMNAVNPRFVLRQHLLQNAIAAAENGDFAVLNELLQVMSRPFAEQPEFADYAAVPPLWARQICVSCSS